MRCQDFVLAIVLADYVENVRESIVVIMTDVRTKKCLRYRTSWIAFMKSGHQRGKDLLRQFSLWRVVYFIARTVDDHTRMVAIAAHSVARVHGRPLFEIQMIVIRILGHRPAIE